MKNIQQFFSAEDKFARHTGIVLLDVGPGWATASMKIEPFHFNGARTVHGGAIFTLADFAFAMQGLGSGAISLAGSYPKDRERLICDLEAALERAGRYPGFLDAVPGYTEEYY